MDKIAATKTKGNAGPIYNELIAGKELISMRIKIAKRVNTNVHAAIAQIISGSGIFLAIPCWIRFTAQINNPSQNAIGANNL